MSQIHFILQNFIAVILMIIEIEAFYTGKGHFLRTSRFQDSETFYNIDPYKVQNIYNATDKMNNQDTVSNRTEEGKNVNVTRSPIKKWQVGRVSRKQYEIINMLWRKTNIFIDIEITTQSNLKKWNDTATKNLRYARQEKFTMIPQNFMQNLFKIPIHQQPSTPSYIEFYYLDENEDMKHKDPTSLESERQKITKSKRSSVRNLNDLKSLSRSPFFAFHINDAAYKKTALMASTPNYIHENAFIYNIPILHINEIIPFKLQTIHKGKTSAKATSVKPIDSSKLSQNLDIKNYDDSTLSTNDTINDYETCPYTTQAPTDSSKNISSVNKNEDYVLNKTVKLKRENDKIKFFEIYDSATPNSLLLKISPNKNDKDNLAEDSVINNDQKILLQDVDQDIGIYDRSRKMKYAKKHVNNFEDTVENITAPIKIKTAIDSMSVIHDTTEFMVSNVNPEQTLSTKSSDFKKSTTFSKFKEKLLSSNSILNLTRLATWSEYPFAAVYVYERYQVHCDAAVISPHWLLASASCLSRHSDDPRGEGRSAFVAYCGERWWDPERLNYVRYSVVHPRYHPRDTVRRHLYNIGAIQVVTSMSHACNNWAPVSIISHQFTSEEEGSIASAVGWGLDRYDKYSTSDLPRRPLTVYEGHVFSDSCPGNSGYRKSKELREEGVKNVYCLLLPPYSGENSDSVHGTLLLVGGKLIALYLQEERRQWGEQSAQYTGIWRLIPWLNSVAREPEETDFFL